MAKKAYHNAVQLS